MSLGVGLAFTEHQIDANGTIKELSSPAALALSFFFFVMAVLVFLSQRRSIFRVFALALSLTAKENDATINQASVKCWNEYGYILKQIEGN